MPSRHISLHFILDVNNVRSNIRSLWLMGSHNQLPFLTSERTLAYARLTVAAAFPKLRWRFRSVGFCYRRVCSSCLVFSWVLYNVNLGAIPVGSGPNFDRNYGVLLDYRNPIVKGSKPRERVP